MPRFIVCAEYNVPRWTTIEVEAATAEASAQEVRKMIQANTIDWSLAEWDFDSSTPEKVWVDDGGVGMPVHWPLPDAEPADADPQGFEVAESEAVTADG